MTLLDSNVLVHYLKGHPSIVSHIQNSPRGELGVPAIVVYELEYGTMRSKTAARRRSLDAVLSDLQQVPFDSEAALAAARIRVSLENKGISIGPLDLLIAGTAASRGATLITNNVREFSRIDGLHVVDWRED